MKVRPIDQQGHVAVDLGSGDNQMLAAASMGSAHPLPIRKILVPIDFSEFSYKSLDYAAAFARPSGAEIVLLHVVPTTYVAAELIAFNYAAIAREAAKITESQLKRLREQRLAPEQQTRVMSRVGRTVEEII